ncbi:MAG: hypothetical protein R3E88_09140 [Myxococcota bacterium]
METAAIAVARAIEAYLAIGFVFGVAFAARGAAAIDATARGATRGFRALLVPGAAALWPWLLARWWRAAAAARSDDARGPECAR